MKQEKEKQIIINKKTFKAEIANTFLSRTIGLLKYKSIADNKALIISPCNSIHTCFMRFSISVIFVDKNYKVIKYFKNVTPWKCHFSLFNHTSKVIEIAYKGNENLMLKKGDSIELF